jgi:hypothetical protein
MYEYNSKEAEETVIAVIEDQLQANYPPKVKKRLID